MGRSPRVRGRRSPVPQQAEHRRLDRHLVDTGLAPSRTRAQALIRAGEVTVRGDVVTRVSYPVGPCDAIHVAPQEGWVGRGALKLDDALQGWAEQQGLSIADRSCIDVGACTGGFTQVLLRRGAGHVVALDVGRDQLDLSLRRDPRVREESGRSVRGVDPRDIGGPFDVLVADLSFISLSTVMSDIAELLRPGGDAVLLVKPQFEVGRGKVGKKGIVRTPTARAEALRTVARAADNLGLDVRDIRPSPVTGQHGNQEFLIWATMRGAAAGPARDRTDSLDLVALERLIERVTDLQSP